MKLIKLGRLEQNGHYCKHHFQRIFLKNNIQYPDSKVHGDNMGPTWVLSAPDGPHVGPMNRALRLVIQYRCMLFLNI